MRWLIVPLIFVLGIFFVVTCAASAKSTPPPACTCGPTCPTPTAKPWPIPASMEKLHGK